ncbi:hypothetical protein F7731_11225 [Cytobacillus depressus]|uniref:Uncharacterized protein n=1 Tax=Cytobacillus depressus TaxID=1602942 RepID=A0A6L3V9N4_9BACI|nr:hypothetical protein [Cytobacillus depressus]KAB2336077.1 hypothetical protein F7731_11225 [Cytobacillus depressus]
MRAYSEDDIRRAVEEVIAAGMEKFLYEWPFSTIYPRQSSRNDSGRHNKNLDETKDDLILRVYSEDDIRRAVEEVIAAGMEKFLYQWPFSTKCSRQSSRNDSGRHNKNLDEK